MSDKLVFYTHPWSRGRIARWMLEECGADYDVKIMEYGTSMKSKDYLSINPMGKVPALKHGKTIITENAAICMYLADIFPDKQLVPPVGSKERGLYYRWLMFTAGPIEAIATAKSLSMMEGSTSSAGHQRDNSPSVKEKSVAGYGCMEDIVDTLESGLLNKTYLCGENFTTADLYLTACLIWYMQFDIIPKTPVFEAYVEKHINRPAGMKAFEIDEALLKQYPVDMS